MPTFYVDLHFVLAVLALGLGLSLSTYRMFATRYSWPMGDWHRNLPGLPILIGFVAIILALLFALSRGYSTPVGGWAIVGFGILFAVLWTTLLRVGSQLSLLLAPAAAVLLGMVWVGGPDALHYQTVRSEVRELRQLLEDSGALPGARRDDRDRGPSGGLLRDPSVLRRDRSN
jgi:hypothetical protein